MRSEIDDEALAEAAEANARAYQGTVSLPNTAGQHRRVAVKIVDDRGSESLKVMQLSEVKS